jgi:alkanesulfonate monooxygenase SsuD/methylene tetrahydromethanopterin reductase-like flavin-dependent oxidoreductase (luciferase family)
VAAAVQQLWVAGKHREAAAIIPDEMVLQTTLMGSKDMVRDRMRQWRAAGIQTLRVYPAGQTLAERLDTLGRAIELVNDINRETP